MSDKYIIFLNDEMKGYLNSEAEAKSTVSDVADYLEGEEIKKNKQIKVFRQNIYCGINIYIEIIGQYYFDGGLVLKHTIKWKNISEFSRENIE